MPCQGFVSIWAHKNYCKKQIASFYGKKVVIIKWEVDLCIDADHKMKVKNNMYFFIFVKGLYWLVQPTSFL